MKYETLKWNSEQDTPYLSRQKKGKILSTYESSLPDTIADKSLSLTPEFEAVMSDLIANMSRFDVLQSQKGYTFPSMLLRSESAASSQIENLTSSIRNIALAELGGKKDQNAKLIVGNVAAMHTALNLPDALSIASILEIHRTLMEPTQADFVGVFRNQTVWVGGSNYSPHGATFVPPQESLITYYLEDLISYSKRVDINPIVKAAIIHAQFETIHPFIDGNGRTGRTLLHKTLREDGILQTVTLPISAGLLNNTSEYMKALLSFQEGNPIPIIEQISNAIELAINIGSTVSNEISAIVSNWEGTIGERKTSSIWKLLYLIIEQPVINSKYLEEKLNISLRAANDLISRAVDYGILRRIGSEKRGIFYQSDEIVTIMDKISDIGSIRRNFQ